MKYFPLGELDETRYELSKRYNLVEFINGCYRLTEKCRKNYSEIDYIKYLQGGDKPVRIDPNKNRPNEFQEPECQRIIEDILSL